MFKARQGSADGPHKGETQGDKGETRPQSQRHSIWEQGDKRESDRGETQATNGERGASVTKIWGRVSRHSIWHLTDWETQGEATASGI